MILQCRKNLFHHLSYSHFLLSNSCLYLTAVHIQSTGEFSTGKTLRAMNVTAYRNTICFHRLSFRIGITSLQWHGKSRIETCSLAIYPNCVKANRPTYPYLLI